DQATLAVTDVPAEEAEAEIQELLLQTFTLTLSAAADAVVTGSESAEGSTLAIQQLSPVAEDTLRNLQLAQRTAIPSSEAVAPVEVERTEVSLGENGRMVLVQPPGAKLRTTGLLVLLPESGTSETALMNRWKPFLNSHGLSIAIPITGEDRPFSSEDYPLVIAGIRRAVQEHNVSPSAIFVHCTRSTQQLARLLLVSDRSGLRGVAVSGGRLGGTESLSLVALRRHVLQVAMPQDRIEAALTDQSLQALLRAGISVTVPPHMPTDAAESATEEHMIADWMIAVQAI
ncbi:MAG: hypothetical protein KDA85_17785, partial [Planctomycetaceae bacterium]|nr:hypothetical protein [Planctomycetaceae bacterium]